MKNTVDGLILYRKNVIRWNLIVPLGFDIYNFDNSISAATEDGKVTIIAEKDCEQYQFGIERLKSLENAVNIVSLIIDEKEAGEMGFRRLINYKENTPGVNYEEYRDEADLPSAFGEDYHDGLIVGNPDLNPDMRALLLEAANRTGVNSAKEIYARGINFLDRLEQIIEQEKSKSEEKNEYSTESKEMDDDSAETLTESEKTELDKLDSDRSSDDKIFSRASDFTPDELEQMSTEDLEKVLKTTKAENEEKKQTLEEITLEEIKKKELISKIKAAVAEGKDLDAKIEQARNIAKEKIDKGDISYE